MLFACVVGDDDGDGDGKSQSQSQCHTATLLPQPDDGPIFSLQQTRNFLGKFMHE